MAVRPWICAATFMTAATVFYIVSLATNYWDRDFPNGGHFGLFQECGVSIAQGGTPGQGQSNGCNDVGSDAYASWKAVQALTIIACVFAGLSALLYFHAIYSTTKTGGFTAESFAFFSGICGLIAMIVYITKIHYSQANYGYSFDLMVAAWALSIITGTSACILVL